MFTLRHTHPKDFPANSWRTKFSDIIGASHTIDYRFWEYGKLASDGVKEVAEYGSTKALESELKDKASFKVNICIVGRVLMSQFKLYSGDQNKKLCL